jgi:hypothetical protein
MEREVKIALEIFFLEPPLVSLWQFIDYGIIFLLKE